MKEIAPKMISAVEAARIIGVHPGTLANWRSWGLGPDYVKHGRVVLYKLSDVKRFEFSRGGENEQRK